MATRGPGGGHAPRQGWNGGVPPGVARCGCAVRRYYWATQDPRMGAPCCFLACCAGGSGPVAIMATREEVLRLRARAAREAWACPRCGAPVSQHARNFECVDALTRQVRAFKLSRRYPPPRGGQR